VSDDDALHELVRIVADSQIRDLKFSVVVTPKGFTSKLEDKNGQRGTAFASSHGIHDRTLEEHAQQLIVQEARRSLRATG
jgi:hypothetical protein